MKPVVLLDVDGVLNAVPYEVPNPGEFDDFREAGVRISFTHHPLAQDG